MTRTKLELTRIGKDKEYNLEPRILIERPDLSHDPDGTSENLLIHGDNLLALKALEQDYAGKVKCIYIDPPFNTGSAFEHYDDGLEHSEWLNLMKPRLEILKNLLTNDGAIFIHIDYNEEAYLRVLMDEIYGRENFRNTIIVSRVKKNVREREKVKALNFSHDVILFYSRSNETLILPPLKENLREERWHAIDAPGYRNGMDYELYGIKPASNRHRAWTKENAENAVLNYLNREKIDQTKSLTEYFQDTGSKLRFIRKNNKTNKPEYFIPASTHEIIDTSRFDLQASSFSRKFPNGEKNEKLIQRILEMISSPGDLVLDSFLGSGTTAAVAHKMGRRWIGIELGDHAYTHAKVRMDKVIDGEQGGISKAVEWKGGGSYRFLELGPSLLIQDQFGQRIINKELDGDKLIQALCKIENYQYTYDDHGIKHGRSSETSFLHVTTRHINQAIIDDIAKSHLGSNEGLLILARTYDTGVTLPSNIRLKKIPKSILTKCEYGRSDYNLPVTESDYDDQDYDDMD